MSAASPARFFGAGFRRSRGRCSGVVLVHLTKRARDLHAVDAELISADKERDRAARTGDQALYEAMTHLIDGLLDERHALLPRQRS